MIYNCAMYAHGMRMKLRNVGLIWIVKVLVSISSFVGRHLMELLRPIEMIKILDLTSRNLRRETLRYLREQLEVGFQPSWFITYHYYNPEELIKAYKVTNHKYGVRDRYTFKTYGDLWKQVARDKWIWRRRSQYQSVCDDAYEIKNVELKEIYGIKELNKHWKYKFPPMLFFHEMGKNKYQYHTHQILSEVPKEFDKKEVLEELFDTVIRKSRKCLSLWKKIDVEKIYSNNVVDYVTKETNLDHLSFDPTSSIIIHPETKEVISHKRKKKMVL